MPPLSPYISLLLYYIYPNTKSLDPSQTQNLSLSLFSMAPAPLKPLSLSLTMKPTSRHHASKPVCVMDASGCLGAALVDKLLHRGYTVHAAVYSHGDQLCGSLSIENKRLKVFRVDPFDYHSIVDAMKGCSGLFYSFEPPQEEESTYDEFVAEVEVRTAHNVLEACAQTEAMEKVVFTSSVTAVVWKEKRSLADDLDERDWSDPNFCRKFKLWHGLAKTLAEKTAWALAMDRGVDMVSINAGLLTATPGLSMASPYLMGAPEMYEDGVLVTVDLKVLVDAHIAVFESSAAFGRYLCFDNAVCSPEDAVKLSQLLAPGSPACPPPSRDRLIQQRIQNKKLNKVMVDYDSGLHVEE